MTTSRKDKDRLRNFFQAVTWIAGICCIVYAVTFLVKRSYDIMTGKTEAGYIAKTDPVITDGKMTPEVLLAFGKVSDPQMSPDNRHILYNVSYTSVEENKSCANLYICNADGTDRQQLTASGQSISNARWCDSGKKIMYIKGKDAPGGRCAGRSSSPTFLPESAVSSSLPTRPW